MSNHGILRMSNIIIVIKNNIATWRMTNFFVNLEKNIKIGFYIKLEQTKKYEIKGSRRNQISCTYE